MFVVAEVVTARPEGKIMERFKVVRQDGNTGAKTQCGAVTERVDRANDLRNRMRMSARSTQPGNSNTYTVERA